MEQDRGAVVPVHQILEGQSQPRLRVEGTDGGGTWSKWHLK
jgi:hypothetical protein